MKYTILFAVLTATTMVFGGVQRSGIIQPYPKEKLQKLEQNVKLISAPAQELAIALAHLKQARDAQKQDSSPAAKSTLQQAMAVCFDRITRFSEGARKSKTPLILGFEDLADYMEVNAIAMKARVKNNPEMKKTYEYMQGQATAIRNFSKDFDSMVTGMEEISQDLAQRSSGWVASSRVASTMSDVYGENGIEGVYGTMAKVVDSMTTLKQLFITEDPIVGSFDSEEQKKEQNAARENFESALKRYHEQP